MTVKDLKFLIISEMRTNLALLQTALNAHHYHHIVLVQALADFSGSLVRHNPDIIIIKLETQDSKILEKLFSVIASANKPVAIFIDQSSDEMIRRAIESGVSSYIVDGFKANRINAIVEVTLNRFNNIQQLRNQRDKAHDALKERKLIEKAKGLLMSSQNISEDEAYKLIRNTAMKQSKKMADISETIITMTELNNLGPK